MGALSGALSGATAGSAFGPIGTGAGALLGGIFGYLGAGRAKKNIADQYLNAEHGVLGATSDAQRDIQAANANFGNYVGAGNLGINQLENYVTSQPRFNFKPSDYFNSPAYQFQLKEGTNAIENAASAQGLGASGNTLRDITQFGQGLAANYYNQAFGQAQSTFQTNQDATLRNLQALIGAGQFGTQNLLTGNIALGQTGLQGAQEAGNYAVGLGTAQAGGTLGQANNAASAFTGLGGLLGPILQKAIGRVPGGNQGAIDPGSGLPVSQIP